VIIPDAKLHAGRILDLGADQGHRLGPTAVFTAGRQAKCLEAINQVGDRLFLAGAARGPAVEFIGSKDFDDVGKLLGFNLRCTDVGGGDRHAGNEQGCYEGQLRRHGLHSGSRSWMGQFSSKGVASMASQPKAAPNKTNIRAQARSACSSLYTLESGGHQP